MPAIIALHMPSEPGIRDASLKRGTAALCCTKQLTHGVERGESTSEPREPQVRSAHPRALVLPHCKKGQDAEILGKVTMEGSDKH